MPFHCAHSQKSFLTQQTYEMLCLFLSCGPWQIGASDREDLTNTAPESIPTSQFMADSAHCLLVSPHYSSTWVSPWKLGFTKESNGWECELCLPGVLVIAVVLRPLSTYVLCIETWRNSGVHLEPQASKWWSAAIFVPIYGQYLTIGNFA